MRSNWLLAVSSILTLLGSASSSQAQQPYWQARERPQARSGDAFGGTDLLRPYGYGNRSQSRAYSTEPPPPRVNPVRTSYPAPRHSYFPGMRTGQGPNRNVAGHVCVPSRRAFMTPVMVTGSLNR